MTTQPSRGLVPGQLSAEVHVLRTGAWKEPTGHMGLTHHTCVPFLQLLNPTGLFTFS